MEICKIHCKLMISKTQDCFANISATKTPIFMKLQTNIHKIVKNDHKIFRKDPCVNTGTRGINVRARVSSRQMDSLNQEGCMYKGKYVLSIQESYILSAKILNAGQHCQIY